MNHPYQNFYFYSIYSFLFYKDQIFISLFCSDYLCFTYLKVNFIVLVIWNINFTYENHRSISWGKLLIKLCTYRLHWYRLDKSKLGWSWWPLSKWWSQSNANPWISWRKLKQFIEMFLVTIEMLLVTFLYFVPILLSQHAHSLSKPELFLHFRQW